MEKANLVKETCLWTQNGGKNIQLSGDILFQNLNCWCSSYLPSNDLGFSAPIAHDRSKEFHWKFNRPVAAKMIQLQNPLLRFLKTTKGNFSGEDF